MKANTTDDIWTWLYDYYIPGTWSKYFGNGDLRTAYEQRFIYDQYNYRMSKIQLRQVRSYGKSLLLSSKRRHVSIKKKYHVFY